MFSTFHFTTEVHNELLMKQGLIIFYVLWGFNRFQLPSANSAADSSDTVSR